MLATMTHFMKGTPYVYQGEELGMTNVRFDQLSDYKDIETLNAYKAHVPSDLSHNEMMAGIYADGRDNARTPMQWSCAPHGGFTNGTPWIGANPNYKTINAEACLNDEDSIFYYYQKLIHLRKTEPAMVYGDFEWLCPDAEQLFIYKRSYEGESFLVLLNHSAEQVVLPDSLIKLTADWVYFLGNYAETIQPLSYLRPYEALVFKQTL
jgi:glycosidase